MEKNCTIHIKNQEGYVDAKTLAEILNLVNDFQKSFGNEREDVYITSVANGSVIFDIVVDVLRSGAINLLADFIKNRFSKKKKIKICVTYENDKITVEYEKE